MPKKKQKYADLIYVEVKYDGEEGYLWVHSDPAGHAEIGEEIEVGIYQFVKTAKVRTKIEVV